jgi:hypothetical protein
MGPLLTEGQKHQVGPFVSGGRNVEWANLYMSVTAGSTPAWAQGVARGVVPSFLYGPVWLPKTCCQLAFMGPVSCL